MTLKVKDLHFGYTSNQAVIKEISFEVKPGECLAILGMNGVGKTTLLKCINQIIRPSSGEIFINNQSLRLMDGKSIAQQIAYVPQGCEFADGSVFDTVLLGRKPFIQWDVTDRDLQVVQHVLETMSLTEVSHRNVNTLSGGEKQKVSIARAFAQQTPILLFDEPTSNLDIKNQLDVLDLTREIVKEKNLSAIVIIHDLNLALRFADKFLILKDGCVYDFGDHSVINSKMLLDVYQVCADVIQVGSHQIVVPY